MAKPFEYGDAPELTRRELFTSFSRHAEIRSEEVSDEFSPDRRELLDIAARYGRIALIVYAGWKISSENTDRTYKFTVAKEFDPSDYAARSMEAQGIVRDAFVDSGRRPELFYERFPQIYSSTATNWQISHAFSSALDLKLVPGNNLFQDEALEEVLRGLALYWDKKPKGGIPSYNSRTVGGRHYDEKFYDDNAWIGLNLIRAYRITKNPLLLEQAKAVFEFVRSGWAKGMEHYPGGVYWQQQRGGAPADRNTVSNAPNAELGIRLYQLTGDVSYLVDAIRMYKWVENTLYDTKIGMFLDKIHANGNKDKTIWTYNQGTMIGASVLLARADVLNDPEYLAKARGIATTALHHFGPNGDADLIGQPPEFVAIYFRNLFLLYADTQDPVLRHNIRSQAESYIAKMWPKFVGHYEENKSLRQYRLIEQSAIVEILAMLACSEENYDLLV